MCVCILYNNKIRYHALLEVIPTLCILDMQSIDIEILTQHKSFTFPTCRSF